MAIVVHTEQASLAGSTSTAVELYTKVGMGIDANTDQALGKTGLECTHQTVGPFLGQAIAFTARFVGIACGTVAPAMLVVTLVVDSAVEDAPAAVFDQAVALRLCGFSQRQGRQAQ
ncbi:hypothetical protein D3C81_1374800 [compost metagenome]